jgi:hypothetical protein
MSKAVACRICGEIMEETRDGFVSMHRPDDNGRSGWRTDPTRCYSCGFWNSQLENDYGDRRVIVKGRHYLIAPDELDSRGRPRTGLLVGFSGSKWLIRFHDGREVVTHNLWHQGEIPSAWREALPNNAEFVAERT